ncbi:hypothetical protein AURDEDRAFT_80293 [Auricularia subglabra TFB-10046 SS5]|nr:hypothetical protein AURDEDRAFT_80293 [Auricularia subglabra TFB-10046 SS5]
MQTLKSWVFGDNSTDSITRQLRELDVPVSNDACRTCSEPCDEGHAEYSGRLYVDTYGKLLGTIEPTRRQVIISTGKLDWVKHIESEPGTVAHYLSSTYHKLGERSILGKKQYPPVFSSDDFKGLSVLNGSHSTVSEEPDCETVLVLPDFQAVVGARANADSVEALWRHALDPTVGITKRHDDAALPALRSYVIPYACVIIICSHKRRDNRCGITAPVLQDCLTSELAHAGWEVHTQLEHLDEADECLEKLSGTDDERAASTHASLRAASAQKRALILGVSHVGGHKWAGNVQIFTPQGVGIYYGRVTPHDVPAVVKNTILEGKVLPELLRGGMNVTRPDGKTLLDW